MRPSYPFALSGSALSFNPDSNIISWRTVVTHPVDVKTEVQPVPPASVRSKNGGFSGLLIHFYTWVHLLNVENYILSCRKSASLNDKFFIDVTCKPL